MFKELIDRIADLGVKAEMPRVHKLDSEPPFIYAVDVGGELETRRAQPMPRNHAAFSIAPIADFARLSSETSEIWHSRNGVTCFIDKTDRRDAVHLALNASPQRLLLENWERTAPKLTQAGLILTLRTTFARCLGRAGGFLDIIRRVKFVHNQQGDATIAHGKASVGRQIEQEVTGAGSIPEYITFEIPIFGNLNYIEAVECAVEPDPATSTFAIIPLPLEIENAIQRAESKLAEQILAAVNTVADGEALVPVYYGKP